LQGLGVRGGIILKRILGMWDANLWNGFIWLWIEYSGKLL